MTHAELVARAARWLKAKRYIVATEVVADGGEIPDALGWKSYGPSILIECKASRGDFLADAKKRFRRRPWEGPGEHRYYLCPAGMIQAEDVPERWGLLWAHPRTIRIVRPAEYMPHDMAAANERRVLISILRRADFLHPGGLPGLLQEYTAGLRAEADRARAENERKSRERAERQKKTRKTLAGIRSRA